MSQPAPPGPDPDEPPFGDGSGADRTSLRRAGAVVVACLLLAFLVTGLLIWLLGDRLFYLLAVGGSSPGEGVASILSGN